MNKKIICFICLLFISLKAICQIDSASWYISVTPQYLANNCFKFDIQKRIAYDNWLGFSQELYFGYVNQDNKANGPKSTVVKYGTPRNGDEVTGAGFTLLDKFYFKPADNMYGFYFGGGFNYSFLDISYQDNFWVPYQKDGITYYGFRLSDKTIHVDRYNGFMGFGFSTGLRENFRADFFIGGGAIYAYTIDNTPGYRYFNRDFLDLQYSGIYPLATMGLGMSF